MVKIFLMLYAATVLFAASSENDVCALKARFGSWYLTSDTDHIKERWGTNGESGKLDAGIHIFCLRPEHAFDFGESTTIAYALYKKPDGTEQDASVIVSLSNDTATPLLSVTVKTPEGLTRDLLRDKVLLSPKTHERDTLKLTIESFAPYPETAKYRLPYSDESKYSVTMTLSPEYALSISLHDETYEELERNLSGAVCETFLFPQALQFSQGTQRNFTAYEGKGVSWLHLPKRLRDGGSATHAPSDELIEYAKTLPLQKQFVAFAPVDWGNWLTYYDFKNLVATCTNNKKETIEWLRGDKQGKNSEGVYFLKETPNGPKKHDSLQWDRESSWATLTLTNNMKTEVLLSKFYWGHIAFTNDLGSIKGTVYANASNSLRSE